jgi:hypothetical protein
MRLVIGQVRLSKSQVQISEYFGSMNLMVLAVLGETKHPHWVKQTSGIDSFVRNIPHSVKPTHRHI